MGKEVPNEFCVNCNRRFACDGCKVEEYHAWLLDRYHLSGDFEDDQEIDTVSNSEKIIITNEYFEVLLDDFLIKVKKTLSNKSKEYSYNKDKLHNFRIASNLNQESLKKSLWGMATKHLVSIMDIVNDRIKPDKNILSEKCLDMVNYIILLYAIVFEEIENQS